MNVLSISHSAALVPRPFFPSPLPQMAMYRPKPEGFPQHADKARKGPGVHGSWACTLALASGKGGHHSPEGTKFTSE